MANMFHLGIAVNDLDRAREFYEKTLGCSLGRTGKSRFDVNFFGHHLVVHLDEEETARQTSSTSRVEGGGAPVRHFGVILAENEWEDLVSKLKEARVEFAMEPQQLRVGTPNEQKITLVPDNCGNVVEFKSMPFEKVFAK